MFYVFKAKNWRWSLEMCFWDPRFCSRAGCQVTSPDGSDTPCRGGGQASISCRHILYLPCLHVLYLSCHTIPYLFCRHIPYLPCLPVLYLSCHTIPYLSCRHILSSLFVLMTTRPYLVRALITLITALSCYEYD